MEDTRELSLRLYDVLEHVGASEEMRRLHRHTATTREIISTVGNSVTNNVLFNEYQCGSSYEGSVTPDLASDRDSIHCYSDRLVVLDVQAAPPGGSFLLVRDPWTYPGQVKLQCMWNGRPLNAGHELRYNSAIDWEGRMCIKHFPGENMHGPADIGVDENGVHIFDHVYAEKCESIPPYAVEWFLRERPYGRPSQEQLHDMSRMGCMFVGSAYVYSGEKDIEWRLSFCLQERQLMDALTSVQHKVYVLLKLIKRNIIEEYLNDETLTSYHCKTCILFAVHMTPVRAWKEENLINCLLQCVKLLIKWIEQGNCPNYFIKDQNLFAKEEFLRNRMRLLHVMRLIVETPTNFLYMIKSDYIGYLLRNGDMRQYREITALKINKYVFKLKRGTATNINENPVRILYSLCSGCYDPFSLRHTLDALQRMGSINGHSEDVTQSSLVYVYQLFHLHIANALVSLAFRYPDMADHQRLVETVDFHFIEASGLDLVNERLARATVLYKSEQYDECFLLLQQIENDFVKRVGLMCPCTRRNSERYYDEYDKHEHWRKTAGMSIGEFINTSAATCVVFLPSEVELAPVPLHYEMLRSVGTAPGSRVEKEDFWFDWAVIDPRIYLYFLQYHVTCKLHKEAHKQVAMDNLQAEIDEDNRLMMTGTITRSRLGHKETAFNLLGWIHMQEGRFVEAFNYFVESWKIRPFHTAAKFHMFDLKAKLSNRER